MTERARPSEMTRQDVLDFHDLVEHLGVRVWLDGGWAVDACLGRQTRTHADLDIIIEQKDLDLVADTLRARGYEPAPRKNPLPWNFALRNRDGHEVDFHVIVLDGRGNGVYGPAGNGEYYPAEALSGIGVIRGRAVACISAEWLVRFHSGYELDDKDRADVLALCQRFRIPVPPEIRSTRGR